MDDSLFPLDERTVALRSSEIQRRRTELWACRALATPAAQQACILERFFRTTASEGVGDAETAYHHSASFMLISGRGSCMSLALSLLVIADSQPPLFDLLVLRSHVILVDAGDPERGFELLERGRPLSSEEMTSIRRRDMGYWFVVPGSDALAAYLDNLGARLTIGGRPKDALPLHREATRIAPTGRFSYNYATALLAADRPRRALRALDHASTAGFDVFEVKLQRGECLRRLGRLEQAIASIDQALQMRPLDSAGLSAREGVAAELARRRR